MRRPSILCCILGVVLTLPVLAAAQDDSKQPARESAALFERLDKNKDGAVTKDEVPEERQRLFERLLKTADKNGDGKLTGEEFTAGVSDNGGRLGRGAERPGRRPEGRPGGPAGDGGSGAGRPGPAMMAGGAIFRALDADGDGKLSASEIENAAAALKKLDKNGDGEITREEIGAGPFTGGAPGGAGLPGVGTILERLKQFDKNDDGKFSKDELPPRLQQRFEEFDANKDGVLDREELREVARNVGLPRRADPGPGARGGERGKGRPGSSDSTDPKKTD